MKPRRMSRTISPRSLLLLTLMPLLLRLPAPHPLLALTMARILPECKLNKGGHTVRFVLRCNSAAGLKAALHNPNVSDDTKEHLQERLDDMN